MIRGTLRAEGLYRILWQMPREISVALLAQQERWFLCYGIALCAGAASYLALPFMLPRSLLLAFALAVGAGSMMLSHLARHGRGDWAAAAFCLALSGFYLIGLAAMAQAVAARDTRLLPRPVGPAWMQGRVLAVSPAEGGYRLLLDNLHSRDLYSYDAGAMPEGIRLRLRVHSKAPPPGEGDMVRFRGRLFPPSSPVMPGAFDFARRMWFQGIGAIGYVQSRIRIISAADAKGPGLLQRWRQHIGAALQAIGDDRLRALARVFTLGDRGGVGRRMADAFRASGLAHLLAISGLHVGLVFTIVMVVSRRMAGVVPFLALRLPLKQIAAVLALAAAGSYVLLSGVATPTLRAFVMMAVVTLAILTARQAISMRSLALAAMIVALLRPESVTGPSFQMSFMAVAGLILLYETLNLKALRAHLPVLDHAPARFFLILLLSSLVATIATAPVALYHFNQVAAYGVLANLLAVPLFSFVIMPLVLLILLLAPLGFGGPAAALLSYPLSWLNRLAENVSAWPGALLHVPAIGDGAYLALMAAALWFALWRGRLRLFALVPLAAGLALLAVSAPPRLAVSGDGAIIALRREDGSIFLSRLRGAGFVRRQVVQRLGAGKVTAFPRGVSDDGTLRCDGQGCIWRHRGWVIALPVSEAAIRRDCETADVLIADITVSGHCPAPKLIVDPPFLRRWGGVSLWLGADGYFRYETVFTATRQPPWRRFSRRDADEGYGSGGAAGQ